jgi:hypothetical protein
VADPPAAVYSDKHMTVPTYYFRLQSEWLLRSDPRHGFPRKLLYVYRQMHPLIVSQRNTYTLLNWGNFADGASNSSTPYVQLLSTTEPGQAHQDFVTARLDGIDTTGDSQYALLPANQGKSSPIPFGERVTHTEQKVIRYLPLIVCISIAALLALVGYGLWVYIRRRRARRAALHSRDHSVRVTVNKGYGVLEDPQPPIHMKDMPSGGAYGYNNNNSYAY